jgi:type IV secretory pathway protease TraF
MPNQLFKAFILLCGFGAAFYMVPLGRSAYQPSGNVPPVSRFPSPKPGVIEGTVWDSEGQPVVGATVSAMRTLPKPQVPSSQTDEVGRYKIEISEPGSYAIVCSKEEDGYPLTMSGFHQEQPPYIPVIALQQGQVAQNVDLCLGPKMAKLVGTVSDAGTGRPLLDASIVVRRVDCPSLYYSTGLKEESVDGRFEVLVPSLPFTLEVTAAGYETWKYNKSSLKEDGEALTLGRGETRELAVRLRPR